MKSIRRQARAIALHAAVLLGLLGTGSATAELLGIKTTTPPILYTVQSLTGNYSFDVSSSTGTFSVNNAAINVADIPGLGRLFASRNDLQGVFLNIQFLLNSAGEISAGDSGDHITVTGGVDTDGDDIVDLGPELLTGRIESFGYAVGSAADLFDVRFEVTGGELAATYYSSYDDIGVSITAESSAFNGQFDESFGFLVKASVAPVPQVCVDIEKQVSVDGVDWRDADSEGDALALQAPAAVEYRLVVANCGDTNLKNVVVSDVTLPGAPNFSVGKLPIANNLLNPVVVTQAELPGLSVVDRCVESGVLPNIAKAVGEADSSLTSEFVSDMDEAYVECFATGLPQIEVIKEVRIPPSTDWLDADTATSAPTGTLGSDAEYRIIVRNLSSAYTVSNLVVVDATLGIDVTLSGTLGTNDGAPGGADEVILDSSSAGFAALSITDACNASALGEVMNMVSVEGEPAPVNPGLPDDLNDVVSGENQAHRICVAPQIEIVKEVRRAGSSDPWLDANDPTSALVLPLGADAEFRFIVTNIGPVELVNAVLADGDLGVRATIATLAPGAEVIVDSGYPGVVGELKFDCRPLGEHMNLVNVVATDPTTLNTVAADDLAYVDCKSNDVRIIKEVRFAGTDDWFDANDDTGLTDVPAPIAYPANVEYRITVTNVGMFAIENVEIVDQTVLGNATLQLDPIAAGESVVVLPTSSSITNAELLVDTCENAGQFINIASVNADVVGSGEVISDTDEALFTCSPPAAASIGDRVWEDRNGNGEQDSGEPGVGNVPVELLDQDMNQIGGGTTTTTDILGEYRFENLAPGAYYVRFTKPSGFSFTDTNVGDDAADSDAVDQGDGTGKTGEIVLGAGDIKTTIDAGIFRSSALGDFAWEDLDGDGLQDSVEPGLMGVNVELLDNNMDPLGVTTQTDADGMYLFDDLKPGSYFVQFTAPDGCRFTQRVVSDVAFDEINSDPNPATGKTEQVDLVSGEINLDVDAGFICDSLNPAIDIRKQVEGPDTRTILSGDSIEFSIVVTNTGDVDLTDVVVSDPLVPDCDKTIGTLAVGANDSYTCTASSVTKGFTNIASVTGSGPNGVSVSDDDPSTVTVTILPATIGDFVWEDVNRNGIQDADEPGVDGVTVKLKDADGIVVQTTTTSGGGAYSFTVEAGMYSVQFELPSGFSFTALNQGVNDALDSDADPAMGGMTDLTTVLPDVNDLTLDAGLVRLAPEIDIRKQEEGPDSRTFSTGDTVTFEIEVTNIGSVDLNNVVVNDPQLAACENAIGDLAIGRSVTFTCSTVLAGGSVSKEFKDTFSSVSYSNNDGTDDFAGPWVENDKDDGNTQDPSDGNVLIGSNNKLWLDDYPNTGTDPSAQRTADLSGLDSATLVFDWDTHAGVDASDKVVVEISSDGGSTWTELDAFTGFSGSKSGHETYEISTYISSQTTVRFRVAKYYGGSNETFKVDNFTITGEGGGSATGFINEACVNGDSNEQTVSDCDTSEVVIDIIEPTPAIDIRKQEEGPDSRTFNPGDTVNFEIEVTNTGNVDLSGVTVTDPLLAACDRSIGNLVVGDAVTYSCSTMLAGGSANKEFKDTFSSVSYDNNDGTDDFAAPWFENDKRDGYTQDPTAGNVLIGSNNKLWLDDYPHTGTDPSAQRAANLNGLDNATLDFDWSTHSGVDTSDAVVVEVSSNGGVNWTVLHTFTGFSGAKSGHKTFDISGYISSQTTVRFRVSKFYGGSNETFKVDNFTITGSGGDVSTGFINVACVSGAGGGQSVSDCDTSEVVLDVQVEPNAGHCVEIKNYKYAYLKGMSNGDVWMTDNRGDDTKWILEDAGNGSSRIRSALLDKTIDGNNRNGDVSLDATPEDDDGWIFEDLGNDIFYLKNYVSGRYLDGDTDYDVDTGSADGADNKWIVTGASPSACGL